MDAWLGLIGAIVGAAVGWGLSEASRVFSNRRQARRNLESAAFVCLVRLLKIQNAKQEADKDQLGREIWYLGGDLDGYRDAIAANRWHRGPHWQLYKSTMPLLLRHDLGNLDKLISRYEQQAQDRPRNMALHTTSWGRP